MEQNDNIEVTAKSENDEFEEESEESESMKKSQFNTIGFFD